jgi:peroxiredoxin
LARANAGKPATEMERESVRLFERVTKDFSDLPHWRGTLGEAAVGDLRELQKLGVGKVPPEIVGQDADGVAFKLSDFHGRVVVLLLSGEWCVSCRAQQPKLRELQTKFRERPVCFLGVMSDPPEPLRQAVRRGDITWRCWCDGDRNSGPITTQWNITAWPTIHVLDQDGVIRQRNVAVAQLQVVLENLLQEQEQRPTRSGAAPSPRR